MPQIENNIDLESLSNTLTNMSQQMQNDTEISNTFGTLLDELSQLSKNHDSYLSDILGDFEVSNNNGIARAMKQTNDNYAALTDRVDIALNGFSNAEKDGSVSTNISSSPASSANQSYSPNYTSSGYTPIQTGVADYDPQSFSQEISDRLDNIGSNYDTSTSKITPTKSETPSLKSTTEKRIASSSPQLSKSVDYSSASKIGTGASIGAATTLGATGIAESIQKLGENIPEEELKPYLLNTSVDLSEEDLIKQKLQNAGYSEEETNNILGGEINVAEKDVDELKELLEKEAKKNKSLRNILKDTYGFDIFEDDNTVNSDKLAMALVIDQKDELDIYDLNNTLSEISKRNTIADNLITEIIRPESKANTEIKKGSTLSVTAIAYILGFAGIAGGGVGVAKKVKKTKGDIEQKEKQSLLESEIENETIENNILDDIEDTEGGEA